MNLVIGQSSNGHPVALEPNAMHQAIELIKGEELDAQLACALLAADTNVHPRAKVFLKLPAKIRQVRTLRDTLARGGSTWNAASLADGGFELAHRPGVCRHLLRVRTAPGHVTDTKQDLGMAHRDGPTADMPGSCSIQLIQPQEVRDGSAVQANAGRQVLVGHRELIRKPPEG